jgi:serine/threonine protein kinase
VAVKILSLGSSQNADAVFEFHEEVRLLALLDGCSNIVRLHDEGQHQLAIQVQGSTGTVPMNVSFMVLELADAALVDLLVQRHLLDWRDRLQLYRDVVKGAHQMHFNRLVHRDIKSDNVLIFEGRPPKAKLADFGRSKDTRQAPRALPEEYEVGRGDPSFFPHEMLWLLGTNDPLDHVRSDLYLLGSVLFELAAGVGLTAFALGNPGAVLAQAIKFPTGSQREQEFRNQLPQLRARYELAYDAFRNELPNAIRHEATLLLRQLTNPDPLLRHLAARLRISP